MDWNVKQLDLQAQNHKKQETAQHKICTKKSKHQTEIESNLTNVYHQIFKLKTVTIFFS